MSDIPAFVWLKVPPTEPIQAFHPSYTTALFSLTPQHTYRVFLKNHICWPCLICSFTLAVNHYCSFWHRLCCVELIGGLFSCRACYPSNPSTKGACETPYFARKCHHLNFGCDQTDQRNPSIALMLSLGLWIIPALFHIILNPIFLLSFIFCSTILWLIFSRVSPSLPPLHHHHHHHHQHHPHHSITSPTTTTLYGSKLLFRLAAMALGSSW